MTIKVKLTNLHKSLQLNRKHGVLYDYFLCVLFWFGLMHFVSWVGNITLCGNVHFILRAITAAKKSSSLKIVVGFFFLNILFVFYFAALILLKRLKQSSLNVKLFFFSFNVFTCIHSMFFVSFAASSIKS